MATVLKAALSLSTGLVRSRAPLLPPSAPSVRLAPACRPVGPPTAPFERVNGGLSGARVRCHATPTSSKFPVDVQLSSECEGSSVPESEIEAVLEALETDTERLVQCALAGENDITGGATTKAHEVSVVLCCDRYMRALNAEWRGKDVTTDVLSFEVPPDDFDTDLPVRVLGDVVISVDTAAAQAAERAGAGAPDGPPYGLLDEVRVLLVHGVLHLLGFDHENGPDAAAAMAEEEQRLMRALGWRGLGLIEAASLGGDGPDDSEASGVTTDGAPPARQRASSPVRLVCLDMDGTLLNSRSQVSPATADAIKARLARGDVTFMLSTGKARPAAITACSAAGLAGPGGIVSEGGPGIFLQGLATYGPGGDLLPGPSLSAAVVRLCFEYSAAAGVAAAAFLGDTCATTRMTPVLEELHTRYYEPLADVMPLEAILEGPPVRKILFMTTPDVIEEHAKPHFDAALRGTGATWTQAVETMLEVLPEGVNKWTGLSQYLELTGIDAAEVMAVGDGLNDAAILSRVGHGVAMGNAVPETLRVASVVTDDNDSDGVAAALDALVPLV